MCLLCVVVVGNFNNFQRVLSSKEKKTTQGILYPVELDTRQNGVGIVSVCFVSVADKEDYC